MLYLALSGIFSRITTSRSIINSFTLAGKYTVVFDANGGTGNMTNQTIYQAHVANLNANTFEKDEYIFECWNTEPDGTGTQYEDQASVINLTAVNSSITLYAQWEEETNEAEIIGGKKYATVQAAINAVAANGSQKTIKLLKNVQLNNTLTVAAGKNIVFNLQNYTLDNGTKDAQIIKNSGTLEIIGGPNGTIHSSANYGAIDNNSTGNLIVSSGNIIATGTRQAIYNNGGTVEIKGDAYLSSDATERATIQNHKPDNGHGGTVTISGGTIISTTTTENGAIDNDVTGTLIVTGGTIISQNSKGIDNNGSLTIGTKNEDVDITSPIIQGATYGVNSASSQTLDFYDGTVKGQTHAFNNENYITDIEEESDLAHDSEIIDGNNYEIAYLDFTINKLIFNANGGTPEETIIQVQDDTAIGEQLPAAPTRERYSFDGWFTDPTGGTEITNSTIITTSKIYYAHWTQTEALITFEAQGGTSTANSLIVNCDSSIGSSNLPTVTKPNKTFEGWFTDPIEGTQIDGTEIITKDETYYAHWSGINVTVTFNPNLGTIPEADATRTLEVGDEIGQLPTTATRTDYGFAGWYTAPTGGTKINATQVIIQDTTYYAHWISNYVAEIGAVKYETLQAAIDDVLTDNTETTITLLKDTLEAVDVIENQNIVLDLQNYTLYNDGTKKLSKAPIVNDPVAIRNRGTIKISNGTVTANAKSAAINNETGGRLIITGGNITNTGDSSTAKRQAVYNNGGIVEISGTAYLSAKNDGTYNGNDRGTIQNLNNGTIIITGGTIESFTSQAIVNQSGCTLILGTEDGTPNSTTPVIKGAKYGIQNKATLNFYDGIVKGVTGSISGTVTKTEAGATRTDSTEVIDNNTYIITYYE